MALPQRYVDKDRYTEEEYLHWEADAPTRSEFVAGEIRAMSGGTDTHAAIAFNISAALGTALRGSDCRGLSSDMKVRTADGYFYYPDVTVVCGPRQFHGSGRAVITNPALIVEFLSDSTAAIDSHEKLLHYQTIASLKTYLLVSQHEALIQRYARRDGDLWEYQAVSGRESVLSVLNPGISLALADVYDGIVFAPERVGE